MSIVRASITTTFRVLNPEAPKPGDAAKDEEKNDIRANASGKAEKDQRANSPALSEGSNPIEERIFYPPSELIAAYAKKHQEAVRSAEISAEEARKSGVSSLQPDKNNGTGMVAPHRDFERTDVYKTMGDASNGPVAAEAEASPKRYYELLENQPKRASAPHTVAPQSGNARKDIATSGATNAAANYGRTGFELVKLFQRSYPDEPKLTSLPVKANTQSESVAEVQRNDQVATPKKDSSTTGIHQLIPEQTPAGSVPKLPAVANLQREGVFGQTENGRPLSASEFMRRKEFEYNFAEKPFTADAFLNETEKAIYDTLRSPHAKAASHDLIAAAESVNALRNHLVAEAETKSAPEQSARHGVAGTSVTRDSEKLDEASKSAAQKTKEESHNPEKPSRSYYHHKSHRAESPPRTHHK